MEIQQQKKDTARNIYYRYFLFASLAVKEV